MKTCKYIFRFSLVLSFAVYMHNGYYVKDLTGKAKTSPSSAMILQETKLIPATRNAAEKPETEPSASEITREKKTSEDKSNTPDSKYNTTQPPANARTVTNVTTAPAALTETQKQSIEQAYYQYHSQEITRLVNESTLMDWNLRKTINYSRFREFFDHHYEITDYSDDLANVPNITSFQFFYLDEGLCVVAKVFERYRNKTNNTSFPHITIAGMHRDYGALSTFIHGITDKRVPNLKEAWTKWGCSEQFIFDYINHPDTLAIFTNQFQAYDHQKVISMPLGMEMIEGPGWAKRHVVLLDEMTKLPNGSREQLMMINSAHRGMRNAKVKTVITNFAADGINLTNSYKKYTNETCALADSNLKRCYYQEMKRSKFILSPGGLGLDCYRHWEAIYMGAIPVLERLHRRTDGWFNRTLANLPIAWIDDYKDLTPAYLEHEYERLIYQKNPKTDFIFEKLTRHYWGKMANDIMDEHNSNKKNIPATILGHWANRET